jgi:transcription termination factor Rho
MAQTELKKLHISELHERARELGVPEYRLMGRDQLVEALSGERAEPDTPEREPDGRDDEPSGDRPSGRQRDRRRRRRERSHQGRDGAEREREREQDSDGAESDVEEEEEPTQTESVTGILDRMPQGYGFLRLSGLGSAEGDVYVSASQIRRCELRPGDEVSGPARSPRRGERHRALIRVESVNGEEPEGERHEFEDLTPVAPSRRLLLEGEGHDPLVRAVDLLAPLALGQRVLVLCEPRSGRSTLLRAIGSIVAATGARLIVLLADERPEEVTEWKKALPEADIVAAPADQEPIDQARAADLAVGFAKRRAESGEDVVVLVDSLSRLALGYRDPARIKRLFGSGRELDEEGSGSLTIVGTVLAGDDAADGTREALETTENVLLCLDADLAAKGITPALVVADCRVSSEETLREPEEMEKVRKLRAELAEMDPEEAAKALGERVAGTKTNAELLDQL